MKYKPLLALALCLTLSGCGQPPVEVPAEPVTQAPAITVAPIEGEVRSPDGKWEVVQSGINEGITAGGLYPSERVQIVSTETEEILWEEDGAYQLRAAWARGSEFAVIARTARTRVEVSVVATASGESRALRLPGDQPIPEYTFLSENWLEWWDEDTFVLRLEGGDGVGELTYRCSPVENPPKEPLELLMTQIVRETLPGEYDLTHDGRPERVELVTALGDNGRTDGELYPVEFELHILNADGETIWEERDIALQHIGWRSLFACRVDGKDYILKYGPTMYQGLATYSYELLSLTQEGEEVPVKENSVSFDVNFGSPIFTGNYDPAAIGAFMDDVHTYLDGECTLLISTQGGKLLTNIPGRDYRGDDILDALYAVDGTWEERFIRFREDDPRG